MLFGNEEVTHEQVIFPPSHVDAHALHHTLWTAMGLKANAGIRLWSFFASVTIFTWETATGDKPVSSQRAIQSHKPFSALVRCLKSATLGLESCEVAPLIRGFNVPKFICFMINFLFWPLLIAPKLTPIGFQLGGITHLWDGWPVISSTHGVFVEALSIEPLCLMWQILHPLFPFAEFLALQVPLQILYLLSFLSLHLSRFGKKTLNVAPKKLRSMFSALSTKSPPTDLPNQAVTKFFPFLSHVLILEMFLSVDTATHQFNLVPFHFLAVGKLLDSADSSMPVPVLFPSAFWTRSLKPL